MPTSASSSHPQAGGVWLGVARGLSPRQRPGRAGGVRFGSHTRASIFWDGAGAFRIAGTKSRLNTPQFLSPYFRDKVLAEAEVQYAEPRHNVRLRHMLDAARKRHKWRGQDSHRFGYDRPLNLSLVGCWKSSAKQQAVCRLVSALNTLAFRGCKSSACATDLSTATTTWTSIFSGKSSPKICHR